MPYYPGKEPAQPEKKDRSRMIRIGLIGLSCALILYGGIRLILYGTELAASRNTSRELQEIEREAGETPAETAKAAATETIFTPEPVPAETPAAETAAPATPAPLQAESGLLKPVPYPGSAQPVISERFLKLRRKSPDIVGWISLDGVEEAVVQRDNTFYLNHDPTGRKNSNGAIFLDEDISLRTRPYTLMLYGHNMKSGNMFGQLKKYKDIAYYQGHRFVSFDSLYEDGRYVVFAAADIDTVYGTGAWYDLWSLATDDAASREKAIRTLEGRSAISVGLDVRADDQLLLLVTCLDGDTERLVVAARRLREGESESSLVFRRY